MPHDIRDQIVDFMNRWSEKTEAPVRGMLQTAAVASSTFYQWKERYGKANEHNSQVPRDYWLED